MPENSSEKGIRDLLNSIVPSEIEIDHDEIPGSSEEVYQKMMGVYIEELSALKSVRNIALKKGSITAAQISTRRSDIAKKIVELEKNKRLFYSKDSFMDYLIPELLKLFIERLHKVLKKFGIYNTKERAVILTELASSMSGVDEDLINNIQKRLDEQVNIIDVEAEDINEDEINNVIEDKRELKDELIEEVEKLKDMDGDYSDFGDQESAIIRDSELVDGVITRKDFLSEKNVPSNSVNSFGKSIESDDFDFSEEDTDEYLFSVEKESVKDEKIVEKVIIKKDKEEKRVNKRVEDEANPLANLIDRHKK